MKMNTFDIHQWIGETTEYDKKQALEINRPKSWCKSVSAFANGIGGKLVWGIADDDTIVGLTDAKGELTNAGALLADYSPVRHSRLFCTRWNGLDKANGVIDALDDEEYTGSLVTLLQSGLDFVRRNPILADVFSRLKYMERRGSGFKKILSAYKEHDGYIEGMNPTFSTPHDSFILTLPKFKIEGVQGVFVDDETTDQGSQTTTQTTTQKLPRQLPRQLPKK